MRGFDILGNIAIVMFKRGAKAGEKKRFALEILKENVNVRTVLEKTDKFKGRLRTLKTKHILGEKTKEALYKENGCLFRFNVESCYFSPRLSSERKEVASMVKNGENVLVMFGGVAPFAIVIAKNSKTSKVTSVELGRECSKYAIENVRRNKLLDRVKITQGDVRKKVHLLGEKFDRIVMARPNLKDSFLDVAFPHIKRGGIIHYYGFYPESEKESLRKLIETEAKKARKKTKILKVKKAGDIAPYKFRYRVDFKVLN
ncbi:MAG: class I SAM-dependent methyltransferase family protein [Nanoarchaeota archaeon]